MTTLTTPVIILTARKKSRGRVEKLSMRHEESEALRLRLLDALHGLERREGHRVTYTALAERVGEALGASVSVATVARWFDGSREPKDRESLAALAAALGVDPRWLAYGDAPGDPSDSAPGSAPGGAPGNPPRHAPMGEPFTFLGPTNKMPLDEARRALGLDEPTKRPKKGS